MGIRDARRQTCKRAELRTARVDLCAPSQLSTWNPRLRRAQDFTCVKARAVGCGPQGMGDRQSTGIPLPQRDAQEETMNRRIPAGALAVTLSLLSTSAVAAIVLLNDPSLPASADGFNITRDTSTGLDWLDVDVSVGRTFADLTGADGSNEFVAGGDFEGFRYATRVELTGAQNGPQLPSLYLSLAVSPFDFSSIGGYAKVRPVLEVVGCFGACAVQQWFTNVPAAGYGYVNGTLVQNNGATEATASLETFRSQGFNWGRSETFGPPVLVDLLPPNDAFVPPVLKGNWLVRASTEIVVPVPPSIVLVLGCLGILTARQRSR
jgi:hypothetical protein